MARAHDCPACRRFRIGALVTLALLVIVYVLSPA